MRDDAPRLDGSFRVEFASAIARGQRRERPGEPHETQPQNRKESGYLSAQWPL